MMLTFQVGSFPDCPLQLPRVEWKVVPSNTLTYSVEGTEKAHVQEGACVMGLRRNLDT